MRDAPREVRRLACQVRSLATDWLYGHRRKLARAGQGDAEQAASFPARVSLEQPILLTDYVEAKIHNITLALKGVNNLPVAPGAIFSFWHVVGRPTSARGFVPGRSLLAGQLRPDYGGGLCLLRRAAASVVRTATVFWVFPATGPWILSWTGEEPASGRAGCRVPRADGPAETQANIVAADARRWVLQSGRTAGRSSFLQDPGRRRSGKFDLGDPERAAL